MCWAARSWPESQGLPNIMGLLLNFNGQIAAGDRILTNEASKLPATSSKLLQSFGLAIASDKIIDGSRLGNFALSQF